MNAKRRIKYEWDAKKIQALRRHMGMSQQQMSEELGVRQQTVSEWETGMYKPRGGMRTLLTLVAERMGYFNVDVSTQPASPQEWADQPIAKLKLKARATHALTQVGLQQVGQVLDLWRQGRRKLLDIPDFGPQALKALEHELRKHGLIY